NLTDEKTDDSMYNDIKSIQDAFETNLSDIGNEISDFRNAYLLFKNAQVPKEQIPEMKQLGIIQFPQTGGDASWLIKNINDSFIQNTLDRYEDLMYQIACHINHNEKLQSNLSGITLRSRLIVLENKCGLEIKAHKNIVKNRLRFLFIYLDIKKNLKHDYKDVKALYTPNIPSDDLATSQMLAQAPEGVISKDTARGLYSFINNKVAEAEKVKKEQQEASPIIDLNNLGDSDG
ncbi:MAG: phage portal protein, partial [Clostridium sp.]